MIDPSMVKLGMQKSGRFQPASRGLIEPGVRKKVPPLRPMPEHVRVNGKWRQKFRQKLLDVKMDGTTARENHSKLISARDEMLSNQRKENAKMEWSRIKAEMAPLFSEKVAERREELANKYHDWDAYKHDQEIGEPISKMQRRGYERAREMSMMMSKGKGKGGR